MPLCYPAAANRALRLALHDKKEFVSTLLEFSADIQYAGIPEEEGFHDAERHRHPS